MTSNVIIFLFSTNFDTKTPYTNNGDYMITINDIILTAVSIFFPISVYLNYTNYLKIYELKEKSIYLEFTLYTIFFLLTRFLTKNTNLEIFIFIPFIISLFKKK